MKLVGFIREYNSIKESVLLDDFLNPSKNSFSYTDKVVAYLKQGYLLSAWMGYFIDIKTKKPIAPDSYYTDGVWVWPSYFPYYLDKYPDIKIDDLFLNYLVSKQFEFKIDDRFLENKKRLEQQLDARLSNKK